MANNQYRHFDVAMTTKCHIYIAFQVIFRLFFDYGTRNMPSLPLSLMLKSTLTILQFLDISMATLSQAQ